MDFRKLRVIFFGMSSRYTVDVLEKVAEKHDLVGIVESAPRHMNINATLPSRKTVAKRVVGKLLKGVMKSYRLSDVAKRNNVPYFYMTQDNLQALEIWLRSQRADIGCVASLSQLLKLDIIKIFPKGIINLHPALLPKYRGPNPWFWTYYEMERTGGVTVHYIDAGEDTGDILLQSEFPIPLGMTFTEMNDIAIRLGADLMVQALNEIVRDIQQPKTQRHLKTLPRARNIKRDEPLIDWENWPIERVWHMLKGSQPWLDALPPPSSPLQGLCSWQIQGYEKIRISGGAYGKVFKDSQGWYVALPEGRIRLKVNFRIRALLGKLATKVLTF